MIADAFACWKLVTMRYIKSKVNAAISHHTSTLYIVAVARLQLKLRKESLHLSKCTETKNDSKRIRNTRVCVYIPILDHLAICVQPKKTKVVFYFGRFVSRLKVLFCNLTRLREFCFHTYFFALLSSRSILYIYFSYFFLLLLLFFCLSSMYYYYCGKRPKSMPKSNAHETLSICKHIFFYPMINT